MFCVYEALYADPHILEASVTGEGESPLSSPEGGGEAQLPETPAGPELTDLKGHQISD